MIIGNRENPIKGYLEGEDLTKIPLTNLAYPSQNVIVHKGKVYTRGGLVNDGVAATSGAGKIHSEFVWKDALGGERPIRCFDQSVQVKYNDKWYTIFSSLDSNTVRVFFATWVDNNGNIIKKRLFFVDGGTSIYQWNGFIGDVASYAADVITIDDTGTLEKMGADAGDVTTQTVIMYSLDGDGEVDGTEEGTYSNDPLSGLDITLDSTPTITPAAGDVVIAKPVEFANEISSSYDLDFIYSYKNHIIVGNYNSVNLYWSHIETYLLSAGLDFTMPAAGSRTALTAIFQQLDGNITAIIARKDVLWVSDASDWYKMTKTVDANEYGLWVDVEKFETGENKGALPMAVSKHKGDIIYIAQDGTMQKITTLEITGIDEIQLISDDIEALIARVDKTDVRLYYLERAIYIICPNDSTMLILDTVEGYWQPPQIMPISCMSVIGGVKYGHHNAENQTFKIFSGRNDLGTPVESKIAFGLYSGDHQFRYKMWTLFGVSARMTTATSVKVEQYFEDTGAKAKNDFTIDGSTVKLYANDDDLSWATHPYADRSWGGEDMDATELKRVMVYDKYDAIAYFDFRPVFTITGKDQEFHLLAFYFNEQPSKRTIGNDLFIPK